jgi:hypothetical protein
VPELGTPGSVRGVLSNGHPYRNRLRLDPQCQSMLNAKNMSGQQGTLVLEPVCSNPVSQRDTIEEGVCDSFHQNIYQPNMLP